MTCTDLVSGDVCHIAQGGVIQAEELQRPLQLLQRINAALARLDAVRKNKLTYYQDWSHLL